MKPKHFSGVTISKASLALLGLLLPLCITNVYAQNNLMCSAVASVNSQLYYVDQTGSIVDQFTADKQSKYSVSISPSLQVAYIPERNPNSVTVVDRFGAIANYPAPESSEGQFVGVSWDYPYLLKFQYHVGPNNDIYRFFSVPYDTVSPLEEVSSATAGQNCATKITEQDLTACLADNKLILNNRILVDKDLLKSENLASLGFATISKGATLTNQNIPGFQIQVINATNEITLKITMPDGTWAQSIVPLSTPFPVNWDEEVYTFTPISIDGQGKVTINISKVKDETSVFDPAIAWSLWSADNHLAVATHSSNDEFLHIVNPTNPLQYLSVPLNDTGRVASIRYDSPTVLMMRTSSGFTALETNEVDKNTSSLEIQSVKNLPATLNIKLQDKNISATVEDWHCQGNFGI